MSWSGYVNARYADAEQAVKDTAVSPDSDATEQVDQVSVAKAAAIALIHSGQVVNNAEQDVAVSISGHANPNHQPASGYANDTVSVTVSQVTRQTPDA